MMDKHGTILGELNLVEETSSLRNWEWATMRNRVELVNQDQPNP